MIAWLVAAACMWRGLTSDEADMVEAEVRSRVDALALDAADLTAGNARDILDAAIAAVLTVTRP